MGGIQPQLGELGSSEINFPNVFRFIDEARYDGWIGCEYEPAGVTEDNGLRENSKGVGNYGSM